MNTLKKGLITSFLSCYLLLIISPLLAATCVSQITQDTTLTRDGSPYYFYSTDPTKTFWIEKGATLTIEDGVKIILGDPDFQCEEPQGGKHNTAKSIRVYGKIKASGTTFTAPEESETTPEVWEVIIFEDGSEGDFSNCTFRNGGGGAVSYAMIHIAGSNSTLNFSNSTFRYADGAIYAFGNFEGTLKIDTCSFEKMGSAITMKGDTNSNGATIEIKNSTFKNINDTWLGRVASHQVVTIANTGDVTIEGCTFSDNHSDNVNVDVKLTDSGFAPTSVVLKDNSFTGNIEEDHFPVQISAGSNISGSDNTFKDYANGYDGVNILSWSKYNNKDITWKALGSRYIVADGVVVGSGTQKVSLTISKGVDIYFHPLKNIVVWGTLKANGTLDKPINFYGKASDKSGKGIYLTKFSNNSTISHVISRHNQAFFIGSENGGENLNINIKDCQISDTNLDGIYLDGGNTQFIGPSVIIENCDFYNIYNYHAAIRLRGRASPSIKNCHIYNNDRGIWLESFIGSLMPYPQISDTIIENNEIGVLIGALDYPRSYDLGKVHINNCSIINNTKGAEVSFNTSSPPNEEVDAKNNWWGDASGPSGVGPGSGDSVSQYVAYEPWLTHDPNQPEPDIEVFDSITPSNDLKMDFGDVEQGKNSEAEIVSIFNSGNANLEVNSITLAGDDFSEFDIDLNGGISPCESPTPIIAPNSKCTFSVVFRPISSGSKAAYINIESNDPDEGEMQLTLSGNAVTANKPPKKFNLIYPKDGATNITLPLTLRWEKTTDPEGDDVKYWLYVCPRKDFSDCEPIEVASISKRNILYAHGSLYELGFLLFGILCFINIGDNKKQMLFLVLISFAICSLLVSCNGSSSSLNSDSKNELSYTVNDLSPNTTYYWKVAAEDENGNITESSVRSFTTAQKL